MQTNIFFNFQKAFFNVVRDQTLQKRMIFAWLKIGLYVLKWNSIYCHKLNYTKKKTMGFYC
jgi:hypothetical protein